MPEQTEERKEEDAERKKRQALATRILLFSRDEILVSMRFLDRALFRMPFVPTDTVDTYGVDGRTIRFLPEHVLREYREEANRPTRAFLHMILHCVLSHPFRYEELERESWDLAADIAAEACILELDLAATRLLADGEERRLLAHLREKVPMPTAERIYRFLLDHPGDAARYRAEAQRFRRDDHTHWIPKKEADAPQRSADAVMTDAATAIVGCHEADTGEDGSDETEGLDEVLVGQTRDEWADVSEHAKMDLETFSREQGFGAGSLLWNLKETLREKYDYREFLEKFAVLGEEMRINEDEFDYIYYTYGLRLYDNMPLVEPLEYRENRRIREFVIALDTSGSCRGATVERFLRKTYEILKNTESYFQQVNIHIIQCDAEIQRDVKVEKEEDFDAYMRDVELSGFGGTDFRPVFDYVDALIGRREFLNLRGLIYFTDGLGTFPERPPAYETAFVFLEDGFAVPEVPPWAVKLVLREDEV